MVSSTPQRDDAIHNCCWSAIASAGSFLGRACGAALGFLAYLAKKIYDLFLRIFGREEPPAIEELPPPPSEETSPFPELEEYAFIESAGLAEQHLNDLAQEGEIPEPPEINLEKLLELFDAHQETLRPLRPGLEKFIACALGNAQTGKIAKHLACLLLQESFSAEQKASVLAELGQAGLKECPLEMLQAAKACYLVLTAADAEKTLHAAIFDILRKMRGEIVQSLGVNLAQKGAVMALGSLNLPATLVPLFFEAYNKREIALKVYEAINGSQGQKGSWAGVRFSIARHAALSWVKSRLPTDEIAEAISAKGATIITKEAIERLLTKIGVFTASGP